MRDERARSKMTLKFNNIDGGKNDKDFKIPMEILAWSWGASNTRRSGEDAGGGMRCHDISMTKYTDNCSPHILGLMATDAVIGSAELLVQNETELTLIFKNARISSLSTGGSGGEQRFTENISIEFSGIDYRFRDEAKNMTSVSIHFPEAPSL